MPLARSIKGPATGDVADVTFQVAPLHTTFGHFGTLFVMGPEGAPPFTALDRQLVISLVEMAASGVEGLGTYDDALQQHGWLRAAGEVSQRLAGTACDEQENRQLIADRVHHLAAARAVTISLPVPDHQDRIRVLVAVGLGSEELVGQDYVLDGSLAGSAITSRRGQLSRPRICSAYFL